MTAESSATAIGFYRNAEKGRKTFKFDKVLDESAE